MVLCNTNIDQWTSIPEVKSHVKKKTKKVNFLPTSDSVIVSAFKDNEMVSRITPITNNAREALLSSSISNSGTGLGNYQSVNPLGYLTQLDTMDSNSQEIQDLKKLRGLLRSLVNSNPTQAHAWLAASRIEEKDCNVKAAKAVLQEACIKCPDSEDIWIEAARLEGPEKAKQVLVKATTILPKSVKIWLSLASKESDIELKVKTLKKALEVNSESVKLWKELISLSPESEAKKYLEKAVICAPHSLDLWLALAKLEPYKDARKTLNNARKQLPCEPLIWISASKLEETQGNLQNVNELIKRGIKTLNTSGVEINKELWISEAIICEKASSPLTAKSILKNTLLTNLDNDNKGKSWLETFLRLKNEKCPISARFFYQIALENCQNIKPLWKAAWAFEHDQNSQEEKNVLQDACEKYKISGKLWEKYLEISLKTENISLFFRAVEAFPKKPRIYLVSFKLFMDVFNYVDAETVIKTGQEKCYCSDIIRISCEFYILMGNQDQAKTILLNGIKDFPECVKLYKLIGSVISEEQCTKIVKNMCLTMPSKGRLWVILAEQEEKAGNVLKARYVLEKGRNLSKDPCVYLASICFELEKGNRKAGEIIMNQALQVCKTSGKLWAKAIEISELKEKKTRIALALEHCPDDPYLMLAIARLFEKERKLARSRGWYEKALVKGKNVGDVWMFYYGMEKGIGEEEKAEEILGRADCQDISKGKCWRSAKKNMGNCKNSDVIRRAYEELIRV